MVSTPSISTDKPLTPKSVEEIRPFPKAERRNPAVKGRKPGQCRILTDTPEKNEVASKAEKKKKKLFKKNIKVKEIKPKSRISLFDDELNKKSSKENEKKVSLKKRKIEDSSSDSSLASFVSDESNIEINDLIELQEKEEEKDEEIFCGGPIKNQLNKWVLVKFATKTTIKHYVGQINNIVEGYPFVKFARRIKKSSVFVWPQENDEGEIPEEDIVVILPPPVVGRRGQLSFPVSFSGLEVL